MTDLPLRGVTRTAKLATLPLGFAGRTAWAVGKRVGGKPAELVAQELQARTADHVFSVLGQLKGGAMKVGQALSIMEAALPEEMIAPYRATLTKLQDAAPPMPTEKVHTILAEQLGPRWRTAKFLEFDDQPAAAASIGQVHKAVWRDGREVAVKIQYPGVAKALMSDLTQLSRVAKLAGGLIPGIDMGPITAELMERMSEELDYDLEARNQKSFARAFRGHPHIVVPDVLAQSERVLVTEWIDGRPLSDIIATGTPSERDDAADLYLEFLVTGPGLARLLHADPHPGNYRLTPDGRLAVFDFGAVNRLPDGLPPAMGQILSLALRGEAEEMTARLREEGFIRESISIDPDQLLSYLSPFLAPLRSAQFTFSRDWLRSLSTHINDPRNPDWVVGTKLNLPPDYLLIHRVWLGGIGVLCQIGGTVAGREKIESVFPGADFPSLDEADDSDEDLF
ncbi:MAG TPA: AarF/ABC1/UbiB kinase family protein [Intrasporangiaceae bacterium]|nr:AarF/ABC1/UbiB kinase family protein [Intrasporangiaceae bacterium]